MTLIRPTLLLALCLLVAAPQMALATTGGCCGAMNMPAAAMPPVGGCDCPVDAPCRLDQSQPDKPLAALNQTSNPHTLPGISLAARPEAVPAARPVALVTQAQDLGPPGPAYILNSSLLI